MRGWEVTFENKTA